jgi:hypothetical protein
MSWLPSAPRTIILLQRIEKGENPLQDVTELFWLFYNNSLSPDEFQDRILYLINKHRQDSPKGGGFIDPEIKEIVFKGPEKAAEIIINRFDTLCDTKRAVYVPDQDENPESLYVSTLLEATRLIRLLKTEGYSEKTREVLTQAINTFTRLTSIESRDPNPTLSKEFSLFTKTIGTFLYMNQFLVQKADGEYENALISLASVIAHYIMLSTTRFDKTKIAVADPSIREFLDIVTNHPLQMPWIRSLEEQLSVDCFEALKQGGRILDPKNIAPICGLIATVYSNWWILAPDEDIVKDSEGNEWKVIEFWQHASGWVEAQLKPSDMREFLNEREDSASEKRLRMYFFGDELWAKIPERAKSSLISSDRDWFGGSVARTEAILNELKIATEEILVNGLWKPLEKWLAAQKGNRHDIQELVSIMTEFTSKRRLPTLLNFERICRMPATGAFLADKKIELKNRQWFSIEMPRSLFRLRTARNDAEHEIGNQWDRESLRKYYEEFVGIGQLGTLPELCRILFSLS